jgi:hypothetical protein
MTINFVWRFATLLIDIAVASQRLSAADRRIRYRLAHRLLPGPRMEFTLLFLAIAVVMLTAWRGPRPLALGLFAAVMIACVAIYLHHATDTLKLSF